MKNENLEQKLTQILEQEQLQEKDPKVSAVKHLSPKYESRITADKDPIVEETNIVRSYTKDDRDYDDYIKRTKKEK
jgi:hypothetical protein